MVAVSPTPTIGKEMTCKSWYVTVPLGKTVLHSGGTSSGLKRKPRMASCTPRSIRIVPIVTLKADAPYPTAIARYFYRVLPEDECRLSLASKDFYEALCVCVCVCLCVCVSVCLCVDVCF